MTLIGLIIAVVIIGVVLHLAPIDARMKQIAYVLVVLLVCLWLLSYSGLLGGGPVARIE